MISFIRFVTTSTQEAISLTTITPFVFTDNFTSRPGANQVSHDIFDKPILCCCLMYLFGLLTGIAATSLSFTNPHATLSIRPINGARVLEPLVKKTSSSVWSFLPSLPRGELRLSWSSSLRSILTGCAFATRLLRSAPSISAQDLSNSRALIRSALRKAPVMHEFLSNPKAMWYAVKLWLFRKFAQKIRVGGKSCFSYIFLVFPLPNHSQGLASVCELQPSLANDITPSSSNSSSSTLVESIPASSPQISLRHRVSKSSIPALNLASGKTWELYAFRRGQRTSMLSQPHYFYLDPIIEERDRQTRLADAMKNPPISLTRRLSRKRAPSVSIVRGVKPKPIYVPAYSKETSLSWLSETIHDRISGEFTGDGLVD